MSVLRTSDSRITLLKGIPESLRLQDVYVMSIQRILKTYTFYKRATRLLRPSSRGLDPDGISSRTKDFQLYFAASVYRPEVNRLPTFHSGRRKLMLVILCNYRVSTRNGPVNAVQTVFDLQLEAYDCTHLFDESPTIACLSISAHDPDDVSFSPEEFYRQSDGTSRGQSRRYPSEKIPESSFIQRSKKGGWNCRGGLAGYPDGITSLPTPPAPPTPQLLQKRGI